MADDHDVSVSPQLVAVNDFSALDSPDRRSLRRGDVDTVMKTRSARAKSRIDRAIHRPEKSVLVRLKGLRDGADFRRRLDGCNDLYGKLSRRARNEYSLSHVNLACVPDAVEAR